MAKDTPVDSLLIPGSLKNACISIPISRAAKNCRMAHITTTSGASSAITNNLSLLAFLCNHVSSSPGIFGGHAPQVQANSVVNELHSMPHTVLSPAEIES